MRRGAWSQDESQRLSPGSNCFWFELALLHEGKGFLFRFVVDDSSAPYGVLRVEYADQGEEHEGQLADRVMPDPQGRVGPAGLGE